VVDDKWMASIERSVKTEMERIIQRIKELAERYETTLPKQTSEVKLLEEKVTKHLEMMGFKWELYKLNWIGTALSCQGLLDS